MHSLFQQLEAATASAPEPRKADWRTANLAKGAGAQSAKAMIRYRNVMMDRGWQTQGQVENRLGYATTVSTSYLAKLLKSGHVERRNRGGKAVFSKREGYEWRWVEGM